MDFDMCVWYLTIVAMQDRADYRRAHSIVDLLLGTVVKDTIHLEGPVQHLVVDHAPLHVSLTVNVDTLKHTHQRALVVLLPLFTTL